MSNGSSKDITAVAINQVPNFPTSPVSGDLDVPESGESLW